MRGSYQTKQQEAIEKLFSTLGQACFTADEAHRMLAEKGLEIGKTTVYRAITRLCQSGRLRRYAPHERGEAAHYQYNPCTECHLHIRCTFCGALAHLHCEEVESFASHLTQHHGFMLDESQTILYGICENCREHNKK